MELVQEDATYINYRPNVKVQAVKKSENDKVTLEGTVFGLYAGEDIINAEGKVVVKKDTLIDKVTSDKEGAAAFRYSYQFPLLFERDSGSGILLYEF